MTSIDTVPGSAPAVAPADLFDLTGQVAVVTGASSGLGHRFARVLAAAGATVWIAARRVDRLDALAATDERLRSVGCEVSVEADRAALIETVVAGSGRVDVLVNNAGTESAEGPLRETPAQFEAVLRTNLTGPFHLAQLAASAAGPGGGGLSVINIGSIPRPGVRRAAGRGRLRRRQGRPARADARAGRALGWPRGAGQRPGPGLVLHRAQRGAVRRGGVDALDPPQHHAAAARRPGEPSELDGAPLFLASRASS
jgi:NAD(P)-dependent dehydrogenase (short-subunit alcohol dehydrogenase family)